MLRLPSGLYERRIGTYRLDFAHPDGHMSLHWYNHALNLCHPRRWCGIILRRKTDASVWESKVSSDHAICCAHIKYKRGNKTRQTACSRWGALSSLIFFSRPWSLQISIIDGKIWFRICSSDITRSRVCSFSHSQLWFGLYVTSWICKSYEP